MNRRSVAVLLIAMGLALTTASVAAEATTTSEVIRIPVSTSTTTCSGESVTVSGTALLQIHTTYDAAGQVHTVYHVNAQGLKAWTDSGKPLPVVITYQEVGSNTPWELNQTTYTIVTVTRFLVGDGTFHDYRIHVTITPNGDVPPVHEVNVERLCP